MHPLALISYPRGVTAVRSRSSRRRARRAAIAVVVGLLGAGAGPAHADPPRHLPGSHANVHQHTDWNSVGPAQPFGGPVTGGRTLPVAAPSDGGSFDAWPAVLIATLAALLGAAALTRRHRPPTTT
jgi:hypothetical protein